MVKRLCMFSIVALIAVPTAASTHGVAVLVQEKLKKDYVVVKLAVKPESLNKLLKLASLMSDESLFYFDEDCLYIHKKLLERLVKSEICMLIRSAYRSKYESLFKKLGTVQENKIDNSDEPLNLYLNESK